jgi:hypothetical protein
MMARHKDKEAQGTVKTPTPLVGKLPGIIELAQRFGSLPIVATGTRHSFKLLSNFTLDIQQVCVVNLELGFVTLYLPLKLTELLLQIASARSVCLVLGMFTLLFQSLHLI